MRIKDPAQVRKLLVPLVDATAGEQLVDMIAESRALLQGHFRLQSGLHSQYFLRFGQLAFRAADADKIASMVLETLGDFMPPGDVLVLGAETSVRYLIEAMSRAKGSRHALVRVDETRRPTHTLIDGAAPETSGAVLVAADLVTTGSSVKPIVELARKINPSASPRLVAFATLQREGPDEIFRSLDVEGRCLMKANWYLSTPNDCELCKEGKELFPGLEFI